MTTEENMASNSNNCKVFHGFSEEETCAAFENSSWGERNNLICSLAGSEQDPSLEFASLGSSSYAGGLAGWPENWPPCGLELVRGGCPPPPPPASCDCSMELGQVGSHLPLPLQSPVATKRATVPRRRSNPVSDKINPGRPCDPPLSAGQQVKWKAG